MKFSEGIRWTSFLLNRFCLRLEMFGPEMLPELTPKRNDVQEHTGNEQLCFDCAGASGSMVGPSRKAQEKTLDGLVVGYVGFLNILVTILEVILELKRHPKSMVTHFGHLLWLFWPSFAGVGKAMKTAVKKVTQALREGGLWASQSFLKWQTGRPTGP